MKRVVVVHQWMAGPDGDWRPWLVESLRKKGFEVLCPEMPEMDEPVIEKWVGKLAETVDPGEELVFVGHSIGCQAILRYLETLPEEKKVRGTILVAPWIALNMEALKEEGEEVIALAQPWMETPMDFEKIKKNAGKVIALFSDDDPYVRLDQIDIFREKLGAETLLEKGKGHFTDTELPSVLSAVEGLFL